MGAESSTAHLDGAGLEPQVGVEGSGPPVPHGQSPGDATEAVDQRHAGTEEIVEHLLEQDPHGQSLEFSERDLAFELPGEGRFRVNISRQRRHFNVVLRVIPLEIKGFTDLNLPSVLTDIAQARRGYVLVTGATGMGKSTTLATMINEVNRTRKAKIITIEDPIEFVFTHQKSMITQ